MGCLRHVRTVVVAVPAICTNKKYNDESRTLRETVERGILAAWVFPSPPVAATDLQVRHAGNSPESSGSRHLCLLFGLAWITKSGQWLEGVR